MSFLGTRNAVAIGVSQHLTLGGPDLLSKLSPSLILQFAGAQTMDPRITFTRSTTATFTGSNGLLQTAAINTPRFDYDPVTLAPLGLLIEEQRTNLMLYSEMFSDAVWAKTNSSITANTIVAPDGALTGDKLVSSSTTNFMSVNQLNVSVISGNSYTMTAYAKVGEWRYAYLQVGGTSWTSQGQNSGIRFDLINGTVAGAYNGQSTANGSISNEGNGWFRISAVWTCNLTTAAGAVVIGMTNTNNTAASTGDGTSGIFIWGAQLEAGAFPTSYIPTVASQVTRAADVAVMTGTNFSDWYNQTEGTLFAETQVPAFSATANPFLVRLAGANSSADRIEMFVAGASSNYRAEIRSSSVTQMLQNVVSGENLLDVNKFAIAYKENDSNSWGRFGNTTDTTVTVPTINVFDFGAAPVGVKYIRKIVYYPRRLSNAALQGITS